MEPRGREWHRWVQPTSRKTRERLSQIATDLKKNQALTSAELRTMGMAGKKTMHARRSLRPQSPPARPGENIQIGGAKVGVKSGAQKSDSTRANRRSAGT